MLPIHMYLQIALKCSDLGHLTSSLEVHKQWVARLEEVSLVQGSLFDYSFNVQ